MHRERPPDGQRDGAPVLAGRRAARCGASLPPTPPGCPLACRTAETRGGTCICLFLSAGGIAPRLPDELQGGDDASTAAPSGGAFHTVVTVDQIVAAKEQQRIAKMVESTEKDEGDRIAKLVAEHAASEQGALAEDAKGLTDSSVTHEQCADDDAPAVVSPAAPSLPPVTGGDRAERPPVEAPSPAPVPQPAAAPHAHKQRRGGELVRVGMSVLVIIALLAAVWRRRVLRFLTRGR